MTTKLWQELEDQQAQQLVGGTQKVTGAQIRGLGSNIWGINYLTIDNKNHDVTTETVSGERGKFSWSSTEIPHAFDVAYQAYINNGSVTLVYSEYNLSPHIDPDGDNMHPFYLLSIELE